MKDKRHASLNIKSAEAHSIAVRLAKLQGTTISAAVIQALRAELRRQQLGVRAADEVARMKAFSRRLSRLPVLNRRSEDEILGYGRAATRMVIDTSALLRILFEESVAHRSRRAGRRILTQLEIAQSAWLRFGRGFHAARLNFGDCASYALARFSGEPLLFVGDDFRQTDVAAVGYV
jgi:hypothetical protein